MGCFVDNLTMGETIQRIKEYITSKKPHQHVVLNADKIVKANKDPELLRVINSCDLINADGASVVWASRILNKPLKQRVTGIDLFVKLVERATEEKWSLYFLGAREEVVFKVVNHFRNRFPGLKIAGYRNGYWGPNEESAVVSHISCEKPDLLFIAISSPKKEIFLNKYLEQMDVPFAMGVGGSFDVIAGIVKRAPTWMQKCSLEWFYRFLQEPRRMFKRYFIDDIYFFYLLIKEIIKR
jgi:N-acetylglucosaminyldiphosphoundecaprenol N-acetyl-beta-D-mannosaminyltransferase